MRLLPSLLLSFAWSTIEQIYYNLHFITFSLYFFAFNIVGFFIVLVWLGLNTNYIWIGYITTKLYLLFLRLQFFSVQYRGLNGAYLMTHRNTYFLFRLIFSQYETEASESRRIVKQVIMHLQYCFWYQNSYE